MDDVEHPIQKFPEIKYPGCQRHFAKMAKHITAPKATPALKLKLAGIDLEPLVSQCFEWLLAPQVLVAVKGDTI